MSDAGRVAVVRLDGTPVGRLWEEGEDTVFRYDPQWQRREGEAGISLTLPPREEAYRHRGLHPFFENLLPEGWLLEISVAKLKIGKDDVFGLLLATCADCVGAVEILPERRDRG